ncbi:MAG: AAA family ATPase [Thermoanaerobaculia bacterium]|nr:AAA family ATPase [Thermoanaerobaculia bacterium]
MRPFRVVVTGSECTGKTTLARALAERFEAPWVPELCRAYREAKGSPLEATDVEPIARRHVAEADEAEARASGILVLDTDLVSTVVYARHYYGACAAWVEEAARERKADLYLLCEPDLAWEPDGQRDRGDRREEMHRLFQLAIEELGLRAACVEGEGRARDEAAARAVAHARADRGGSPSSRP